ncbi:MAG: mechanosensitive ion channel family protein [Dehalococcoidia bacterium]
MEWFMNTGIRVIAIAVVAAAIFLICRVVIRSIMKKLVSNRMAGEDETEIQKRTNTLSSILIKIVGVIILLIAVITILPEFGVNITSLIAAIGIGGLAIAFAAQSLVKDFITGFFIFLEDHYRVGDVVSIAGVAGVVEDIALRRTVLRDADGNVHSVPNGKVEMSTNMTKKYSRVNLNVSVGYGENLKRVIDTINRTCREMAEDPQWKDDFITTPSVLRVDKLGDSGIDMKIMGDTRPSKQWAIMGELRLRLKNAFDSEGIEIPWPHTKVYFGNAPTAISEN